MKETIVHLVSLPQDNHGLGAYLSSSHSVASDIQTADIVFVLVDVGLVKLRFILLAVHSLSHYDT